MNHHANPMSWTPHQLRTLTPEERELVGIIANCFIPNDKDRAWIKKVAADLRAIPENAALSDNGFARLRRLAGFVRRQLPRRLQAITIGGLHA